ncbi:serine/threonine-protein kinase [Streptomyces sp. NPDC028635]|uniref:serine/threonine-protein kinase n=1 Tax=Streptomyces sp. NPDC028635 TaxID=3154800 RepID=UPI0033D9DFEE
MRLRQPAPAPSRCFADILAGRYRLDRLIGSGGAADVHLARDLRLERPVAVKVFRTGADADLEERFHNEAVILARLQHPGLVTVYDAGRHEGRPYLVMELIDGPTLKRRIAAGPLPPDATAALGSGLARALAHAHEAGIVHRDVKPSNIILDASGRPHLTDFGISRLLDATTRTAPGSLIGTAAYLAPEQVLGQTVGPAADVYALGLVLLECLTTRLEYDGAPLEAAIARLHRAPVLPESVPEELAGLLREMTALDPGDRPSAHECARTLSTPAAADAHADLSRTAAVTSVVAVAGGAPLRDPEPTRPGPSPAAAAGAGAPKGTRGRLLAAGGAVALATAMAATLAVADGTSHGSGGEAATRAVSSPSPKAPHTSPARPGAAPAAPASPTGDGTPRLRDAALEVSSRPAPAGPDREPVTAGPSREHGSGGRAGHGSAASPPRSGHGDTAKKGKQAHHKARKKDKH